MAQRLIIPRTTHTNGLPLFMLANVKSAFVAEPHAFSNPEFIFSYPRIQAEQTQISRCIRDSLTPQIGTFLVLHSNQAVCGTYAIQPVYSVLRFPPLNNLKYAFFEQGFFLLAIFTLTTPASEIYTILIFMFVNSMEFYINK